MLARASCVMALCAGQAATATSGCSVKNPDFCCSTLDSCSQVGVGAIVPCDDPAQPYCDDDGAFGAARACIPDPGTTACTGPADCATPERPRCDAEDTGACIGCAGEADCTRFAATPHCDDTSGACVACVTGADCGAAAPVCGADHTCRPCAADGECAGGVCAQAGTCPAEDAIVYVDRAAAAGNTTCTRAAPCPTIALGLAAVTAPRRYLKLAPASYDEAVVIDGKMVELAGTGAELTALANQVIDVRNGATVTIGGLAIHDSPGRGVRCQDSAVTLRQVTIERNFSRALEGTACTVIVDRSQLRRNAFGGASLIGGRTTLRNSFVVDNGGMGSGGGLFTMDATELVVEFNTFAGNVGDVDTAAGLFCLGGGQRTVTNNIVVGAGADQVQGCGPTYTLSNEVIAGTGNLVGAPTFRNAGAGDYHLAAGSMGLDAADPAATLATDFDGEARPHNGRSDLGADELH